MTAYEPCDGKCGRDNLTVTILVNGKRRLCRHCWKRENAPTERLKVGEAKPARKRGR